MTRSAVLLMDLQKDFLGTEGSRMPVKPTSATAIINTANAILRKEVLKDALPILIVNCFRAADRVGNFFRNGATVEGTVGAGIDGRIRNVGSFRVFAKASPSAFTNPELDRYLQMEKITDLYVMGVFAEGCVRSTVLDARRRGYVVHVLANAVASNASWKKQFGLWPMKRAGAKIVQSLPMQPAS